MQREGVLYVLKKLGIHSVLPRANNVQISCPLARFRRSHLKGTDSRPSMGISISEATDSYVHCFTCKWGSTLSGLIDEMYRLGLVEEEVALHLSAYIADLEEVSLDVLLEVVKDYDVCFEVTKDKVISEDLIAGFANKTNRYILDRGLKLDTLRSWESGYDRGQKRITFPVRNWKGQLVGLVGRGIHKGIRPAALNYWKFPKGRYLYGEHKLPMHTTVIVVEGPIDTLSIWQRLAEESLLTRYSVVGLFGSDITTMQVRKLVRFSEDVILFLDNDAAGWAGQNTVGRLLQNELLVRVVRYPSPVGGDPDELMRTDVVLKDLLDGSRLFVERRI